MPQRRAFSRDPLRTGWKRSAAKTPAWQVNEESTSTVVLAAANGMFSFAVQKVHSSGAADRSVKYMAKSPAKNMSSLASHTIVPTDTGFGRLTLTWGLVRGAAVAVDTLAIMAERAARWAIEPAGRRRVNVTPSPSGAHLAADRPGRRRDHAAVGPLSVRRDRHVDGAVPAHRPARRDGRAIGPHPQCASCPTGPRRPVPRFLPDARRR